MRHLPRRDVAHQHGDCNVQDVRHAEAKLKKMILDNRMMALAILAGTATKAKPSIPLPERPVIKPVNQQLAEQPPPSESYKVLTTEEALAILDDPKTPRVPGRTLPVGHQWDGRELPGHGKAAARRLRQMARQQKKEQP